MNVRYACAGLQQHRIFTHRLAILIFLHNTPLLQRLNMETLEPRLIQATDSQNREGFVSPDIVVAVVDCKGLRWSKSAGDADLDSVIFFASQGKLLTVVAAMQAVERGLIGLDDDLAKHLPELAGLQVLDSKDRDGKWKTRPRKAKISLRQDTSCPSQRLLKADSFKGSS